MSHGPVIHFFAGKGGAGKTTLATAHALNLLEDSGKEKILLLSLEVDGGLGDLIRKPLTAKPVKVATGKVNGGLFVAQIDPEAVGAAFAGKYRPLLAAAAVKGAVLSEDEVRRTLEASLGNPFEQGLLFHLLELVESKEYDHVVIDGLSTTHTLRQLEVPNQLRRLCALIRAERTQRPSKTVQRPPTPVDELVTRLEAVQALLKDPARFAMHVVAVAEPVAESQVKLMMRVLGEKGIPVAEIVANLIEDKNPSRDVANRRGLQAPHVRKYAELAPQKKVELVQRRIVGPRGLDEVKLFAREIVTGKESKALQFSAAEGPPALVKAPSMPPIAAPPLPPTRFIFFVGSGGAGKSSCAAAAAVTLTEKEGPVLLISTDPSHSLSDVLLSRLTDTETQVKGTKGLYAREIDFQAWNNGWKKKLKELAEPLFGPEAKGEPFALDKEAFRNLLDLAPGGMDEWAAMNALTDALVQERFKRIVIDPAPSSNSVRILEFPAVARAWLTSLLGVVQRHKAKGATLVAWIEAQLKHLERFERAVLNPTECRFVVVTRGEDLMVPAAERLTDSLRARKLPVERVLVNRVLPKTTDEVTEERRRNELEVAKLVEKKIGLPVTMAPALGRHPAGLRELKAFRTSWYALSAVASKIRAA
jgi:arsenite/tail-anchored protein-transporting ATPase